MKNWKCQPIVLVLFAGLLVRLQFVNVPVTGDEFAVIVPAIATSEGKLPYFSVTPDTNLVNLGHPPLTILIYGIFIKLFGGFPLVPRALLIVFSLGKILLVYSIARAAGFADKVALISASIYAIAFDGAVADMEINFGAVGYFFILGFVYLFFKWLSDTKNKLPLLVASISFGLSLFTYIVPTTLAWLSILLACALIKEYRKGVRWLLLMLALGGSLYVSLWGVYLSVFGGGPELFFRPLMYLFVTKAAIAKTSGLLGTVKNFFIAFLRPAGLLPLLLLVAIAGLRRFEAPAQKLLATSSAIFVALLTGIISTSYLSRYFANTYPFIAIILAAGMRSIKPDKGEILRNTSLILVFLGLLLVKYYDRLETYFWTSTKSSNFLFLWYLPVALAILYVLFQFAGKRDFKKAGGVCLSVFLTYTFAHYAAFQAGLPIASFGAEYYNPKSGILEAAHFVKENTHKNETIMAPPDLAYSAGAIFRNLDIYSMLIFDGASQTGMREAYGSDIPKYSPGLFCKYNVKFVIIPKDALDDVPTERMRDVEERYERLDDVGRYAIFGRRPGWNFNRCT